MFAKLQKYSSILVILVIVLASSWSLFSKDFFIFHDFTQGARIVEMTQAIQDGHLPPIWSSNLGYGYGMPLFEFYAPLPYFLGSLSYMLGISLIGSVKLLMFISTLFTAIGAYLLGKKLFGNTGGLLVSAALTMAPYRAVNLFVRGAISEAWGIMALPFILLGIIKTIKNEKNGWLLLTVSILVLLLSHNLTALVFLPLSVVFGAGYLFLEASNNKKVKRQFLLIVLKLASFYALAVLLSSYYTIPALLEKDFTRLESTILAEYFDYRLHFVGLKQFLQQNWGYGGSTYGPEDGISFYLGLGQILGLFLSGYLLVKKLIKNFVNKVKPSFDKNNLFYLLLVFLFSVSLFMTTNKSLLIWEYIPTLSFLQFPWRYLSATAIFLSLVVGSLTLLFPVKPFKYGYSAILIFILVVMNAGYFRPQEFTSNLDDHYYSDVNKLRYQMSNTLPDYIPIQIKEKTIEPVSLEGDVLFCQVLDDCTGNFSVITNKVHKKVIKTGFTTNRDVIFTVSDFPGWTTKIDSKIVETLRSDQGFIKVIVPAGEHVVEVKLENTDIRKIANLLSSFGLLILSTTFFWYYKRNDR